MYFKFITLKIQFGTKNSPIMFVYRFVFDNQFWRYNGRVNNAFGTDYTSFRVTCRTIFTG